MTVETFARFKNQYRSDPFSSRFPIDWSSENVEKLLGGRVTGFSEFLTLVAHTSYEGGLIRFLLPHHQSNPLSLYSWNSSEGWTDTWTKFKERLFVFAYDWLGRQIAFDRERIVSGELMVSILEPGTGEVLEVPTNFVEFIEGELIEYHEAALASNFYKEWRDSGGSIPELNQCIGYKIPLFLGGTDTVDNLEIIDLDVYVTLCGALFEETLSLSPGQKVSEIEISKN
jgi:hypothetical protein